MGWVVVVVADDGSYFVVGLTVELLISLRSLVTLLEDNRRDLLQILPLPGWPTYILS